MDIIDAVKEKEVYQKELMRLARKEKIKRKLIGFAVVCAVALLIVGMAWLSGRRSAKLKTELQMKELTLMLEEKDKYIKDLLEKPIVVSQVNPEIVMNIINSEMNDISELATAEYLFTNVSEFSDSKQIHNWNVPLTEKSFMMKWDGVIKAGIKLENIYSEVSDSDLKITIFVPAAEILSYQVDHDSVEVLDEKNNIFNTISVGDKVDFDAETEEAMKQRAIENGLLEKAQKNAEAVLYSFLRGNSAIGTEYVIEFSVISE